MSARAVGRERELASIGRMLSSCEPIPLTVIAGPAGIGRTTLLDLIAEAAAELGLSALRFNVTRYDSDRRYSLVTRLGTALLRLPADPRALQTAAAVPEDGSETGALVAALAAMMLARPGLVLLVDDAHLLDPGSQEVFAQLVRQLGPRRTRWICTARTPVRSARCTPAAALLDRLCAERLARVIPLGPLSREADESLIATLIQARPHAGLSRRVRSAARGVPAATRALVECWLRDRALRVVEGYGYLPGACGPLRLESARLREWLRELPDTAHSVAKAAAVLAPLGPQLAVLIAASCELDREAVDRALLLLVDEGFLTRRPSGWRFTTAAWAQALDADLGPWERQELARVFLRARWDAAARPVPERHVAEQLGRCGAFGPRGQVFDELLALGQRALPRDPWSAVRSLSAAIESASDSSRRWAAMAAHAVACVGVGAHELAERSLLPLLELDAEALPGNRALDVCVTYVATLWGLDETDALHDLADGVRALGHTEAQHVICRAFALGYLNRWNEAYQHLDRHQPLWAQTRPEHGTTLFALAGALTGRPEAMRHLLGAGLRSWVTPGAHLLPMRVAVRVMLTIGDTSQAEWLIDRAGLCADQLHDIDRSLLAWERGDWDGAIHHARTAGVTKQTGLSAAPAVLQHGVAAILLGQGRPAGARAALSRARTDSPALPHLFDVMDTAICRMLGELDEARKYVAAGLDYAAATSIVPGTEDLWLHGAELALQAGDLDEARWALLNVERTAQIQQTDRSRLLALLTRLSVDPDAEAAAEALAVARQLGQPRTLARTLTSVVEAKLGPPELLGEAYDILGGLGAVLYRHRLRQLMRRLSVQVPNRAQTIAENDHLLATMVADGASNRELSRALLISEKSAESMLTRLFARTGYRSRVDLATAVVTGEYPARQSPGRQQ